MRFGEGGSGESGVWGFGGD
jgi:hypothetical protein